MAILHADAEKSRAPLLDLLRIKGAADELGRVLIEIGVEHGGEKTDLGLCVLGLGDCANFQRHFLGADDVFGRDAGEHGIVVKDGDAGLLSGTCRRPPLLALLLILL